MARMESFYISLATSTVCLGWRARTGWYTHGKDGEFLHFSCYQYSLFRVEGTYWAVYTWQGWRVSTFLLLPVQFV